MIAQVATSGIGCGNGFDDTFRHGHRVLRTIDLFGSNDRRGACQQARFDLIVGALGSVFERLVENDTAGGFALADLCAKLAPLAMVPHRAEVKPRSSEAAHRVRMLTP